MKVVEKIGGIIMIVGLFCFTMFGLYIAIVCAVQGNRITHQWERCWFCGSFSAGIIGVIVYNIRPLWYAGMDVFKKK